MVDRNKYGAIRELARRGVPKKQIARQLEVTVKTVRRALQKPQWQPYQRQKPETTVLLQFEQWNFPGRGGEFQRRHLVS